MNFKSITFKILAAIIGVVSILAISMIVYSDIQIKRILDKNQETLYGDRVDAIIGILQRGEDRLQKTGMVEGYIHAFQDTTVESLRSLSYKNENQSVYPFIVDSDDTIVMHPVLSVSDTALVDSEVVKAVNSYEEGTITRSYLDQEKWYTYKRFDPWGWTVFYTVPTEIKYKDANKFRNTLAIILIVTTILSLLLLSRIVMGLTKPIVAITKASKQISEGNLDIDIEVESNDEYGVLATSFNDMRASIKSKIGELNTEIAERKHVEDDLQKTQVELKDNRRMLELVMDTIPQSLFWKNRESVYLGCNKKFAKNAGLSDPQGIVGLVDHQLPWQEEEADFFYECDQRIMLNNSHELHIIEQQLQADGKLAWLDTSKIPLYGDNGEVVGLLGMYEDVTERKAAEEALRLNYIQLRALYNTLPIIIWSLDKDGVFTLSEGKELQEIGLETGQVVGLSIFELYKDLPEILDKHQIALSGKSCEYESVVEGNVYHNVLTPYFGEDKAMLGVNGLAINVTEKKRVEAELNNLQNYLTNIIDSMPSILVGVDIDGRVTQWNKVVEESTGISAHDAFGKSISDVLPSMAAELQKISESIRTRKVITNQKRPLKTEEGIVYEDMTIYPLIANGVQGAVIRLDNVTDQVRIEEMMVQSEKMLSVGGLAAGMAHEINNPLAGMIQTAKVMKTRLNNFEIPANIRAANEIGVSLESIKNYMEDRSIFRMIDTINESGGRVAEIVNNMLSFARKTDSSSSLYDPMKLLDQTLELANADFDLNKQYDFKAIKVIKKYETELPLVPCEGSKIQQVLLNLLRNGAQAMQGNSSEVDNEPCFTLQVGVEEKSKSLEIIIEDNGPGMDEETCKRVFEPFFTTKPVGIGTGLGLSVSYFIITENHKGELSVESEAGVGCKFIIKLPLAS